MRIMGLMFWLLGHLRNAELISTETIDGLVQSRVLLRKERRYEEADNIKRMLEIEGIFIEDIPYKQGGGGSKWKKVVYPSSRIDDAGVTMRAMKTTLMGLADRAFKLKQERVLTDENLAALAMAILAHSIPVNNVTCEDNTLVYSSTREMQGRKFADAAFEFSMAGVCNSSLYDVLVVGGKRELLRYGLRKSCRPVDIAQVIEKFAAAGVVDESLYKIAVDILEAKRGSVNGTINEETYSSNSSAPAPQRSRFSLFSDRPLLWLWRYAARQKKYGIQAVQKNEEVTTAESQPLFDQLFTDTQRPLVIDLGCGYGVSLLGLASDPTSFLLASPIAPPSLTATSTTASLSYPSGIDDQSSVPAKPLFNFLGCDMSPRAVAYASGIASRWGLSRSHCAFVVAEAEACLLWVKNHYPGDVVWISINFPSPYTFESLNEVVERTTSNNPGRDLDRSDRGTGGGNSQLPDLVNGFMVTPTLIDLARENLAEIHTESSTSIFPSRYLYLQSNVEDVAVTLRRIVKNSTDFGEATGFYCDFDNGTDVVEATWTNCLRNARNFLRSSTKQEPVFDDTLSQNDYTVSSECSIESSGVSLSNEPFTESSAEIYSAESTTLRQKRWVVDAHGERARGNGFIARSPLPAQARTETEAACQLMKKAVYRLLFPVRSKLSFSKLPT